MVTADADGQRRRTSKVAGRLAERPRRWCQQAFPARSLRSRFEHLTRFVLITGKAARYQAGLRGWPAEQCRECLIPIQGYDFELEALVRSRGGEMEVGIGPSI